MLACSIYVDLNPIRAKIAETPEESDHTSAKLRIDQQTDSRSKASDWLAPLTLKESSEPSTDKIAVGKIAVRQNHSPAKSRPSSSARCSDKGFLPMTVDDYLMLLDWTGRQVAAGKSGVIPSHLAPILLRLGIEKENWLPLITRFGGLFFRVAGNRRYPSVRSDP